MIARLTRLASSSSRAPSPDDGVEQVSLSELNGLLEVLADMFPEHEVALLRKLLLEASQESRLHIAANALVQDAQRYAQNPRLRPGRVEDWEKFHSTRYKNTVEKLLVPEFQGLAKSTIRNVLSENNHDYIRSRDALSNIASKSWRFSIAAWIARRKAPPPKPHLDVTRKSTGCVRLDDEIYALGRPERQTQSLRDEKLARDINEDEHSRVHGLLECQCCFGDYTWEDMAVCTEGHFFCRGCLDRSVKEALFGQGSCLLREKWSVRCISSIANPACEGFVAHALLPHVVPVETLDRMEQRFARDELQSSGLRLVRCPACSFAAVDTSSSARFRPGAVGGLALVAFYITHILIQLSWAVARVVTPFRVSIFLLFFFTWISPRAIQAELTVLRTWSSDAITRVRRRKTGVRQVFQCENPRCGMASCIDCGKAWAAFHDCRRDAFDSQRLYVERAMSEAIKRTCPQCHTSFVKSDGCNKLTCPCGYEMCYVCRADVRGVRYSHYCQHFRLLPGTACTQCDKCNLYETEDEQAVAAAAARRAAGEWVTSQEGDGADAGVPYVASVVPIERLLHRDRLWLSWAGRHAERVIECIFEW